MYYGQHRIKLIADALKDGVPCDRIMGFDLLWDLQSQFNRRLVNIGGYSDSQYNEDHPGCWCTARSANGINGGLFGYVDSEYKVVVPLKYTYASNFDNNGLAEVSLTGHISATLGGKGQKGGKWGFIDIDGNEIIPLIYDHTQHCHKDYYIVQKVENGVRRTGVLDYNGKVIVPILYSHVGMMSDYTFPQNLVPVMFNNHIGAYDFRGNLVIPFTQQVSGFGYGGSIGLDFTHLV